MTTYYKIPEDDVRALHRFLMETAQSGAAIAAAATRSALALEELETVEEDDEPPTEPDED
jgi:hypothetical protein